MKKNNSIKNKLVTRFVLVIGILLLINIISSRLHKNIDLTAEKRFSLSEPTKQLLKNLPSDVTIEVYLEGSFPAGFQRLQESTREILQQFKDVSNNKVKFEFFNPLEGKTEKEKEEVYKTLASKGITPVNLQVQQDEESGYSEKLIYPSAKVSIANKDAAVNLLESHISMSPDERLHHASLLLEYKFASAIKQILQPDKKKVALLVGQNNLLGYNTLDILYTLENTYDVDTINLTSVFAVPKIYSAAIVLAPTVAFDEKDKFKIDQYVMNGGKMLWCFDELNFAMDSLRNSDASLAIDYNLNLEDMLFRYGVRVNPDYIEDYQQATPIPVTVGMIGNQPDIKFLPWAYFPFAVPNSKHPIVNNMDPVMFTMVSSIDTIGNPEVKKTVLLSSSNRSRRVPAPVRISLSSLKFKPTADMFKQSNIPMAVLLEGKFKSIFENRVDPKFLAIYKDSLKQNFSTQCSTENKMIVISDANVAMNDFSEKNGPMECGYNKFSKEMYGNKTFILNCMEYLTEDVNLLEARNRNEKLRLLDMARIKKEKLKWQIINIAIPIALVLIFANAYFFFRKRKYEQKKA